MELIKDIIIAGNSKTLKQAPHELSECSNLIEEAGLFTEKYNRKYWLGKIKKAKVSFGDMLVIIKNIKSMDPKYNKGGYLTNLLTKLGKERNDKEKNK